MVPRDLAQAIARRMRQLIRRLLPAIVVLAVLLPVPAGAGQVNIEIHDDNTFAPDEVGNQVGDTVRWFNDGMTTFPHNVREDGQLFRSGDPTSGLIDFPVVFSAGTFHYYCEVHGSEVGGMDGLVRIPVRFNAAPDGLPFTVVWATDTTETGSIYDVQFRVGSGDWRRWKRDTTAFSGRFGRNRSPVRVRDGVRYRFRARSQEGTADSRWSPVRSFVP
jgi:plastocyanin